MSSNDIHTISHVGLIILVILFWILGILLLIVMISSLIEYKRTRTWTIARVIYCLLPWSIIARAIDMTIALSNKEDYLTETISEQQKISSIFLGGISGYIFFANYVILAVFWYLLYSKAHDTVPFFLKQIRFFYLGVVGTVFTIYAVLVILLLITSGKTRYWIHLGEAMYAASLYFVTSISFSISGIRVYFKLVHLPAISSKRLEIARKIGILTIVLTILFFLRACMIILDFLTFKNSVENIISKLIFQIFFEFISTIVILFVFRRRVPDRYDEPIHSPQGLNERADSYNEEKQDSDWRQAEPILQKKNKFYSNYNTGSLPSYNSIQNKSDSS